MGQSQNQQTRVPRGVFLGLLCSGSPTKCVASPSLRNKNYACTSIPPSESFGPSSSGAGGQHLGVCPRIVFESLGFEPRVFR